MCNSETHKNAVSQRHYELRKTEAM